MNYNYISGMAVIETVAEDYNLQVDDWIPLAPRWIYDGLRKIGARMIAVQATPVTKIVTNGIFDLPDQIHTLDRITDSTGMPILIDNNVSFLNKVGTRIDTQEIVEYRAINNLDRMIVGTRECNNYQKVAVIRMNKGEINSNDAFVTIHYKKIPSHYVEEMLQEVPIIPDTPATIEALSYYVLMHYLMRNNVHATYKLGSPNPLYDPNAMWLQTRRTAKFEINELSVHDIEVVSRMLTTMFDDKAFYYNKGFFK